MGCILGLAILSEFGSFAKAVSDTIRVIVARRRSALSDTS